jgi:hypothetical protein
MLLSPEFIICNFRRDRDRLTNLCIEIVDSDMLENLIHLFQP